MKGGRCFTAVEAAVQSLLMPGPLRWMRNQESRKHWVSLARQRHRMEVLAKIAAASFG
jgi:hypothetical protein